MGSLLRVWQRRTPRSLAPHVMWLLVLTVPILVHAEQFTGTVVGISDGDTISVLRQGKAVTVHLYGVACPARRHAFGAQARQFTRDVAFQQVVAVLVDSPTRRSRRLIAGVQLPDGRDLSQALVQAGYAWHDSRYAPADRRLAQLEAEARAAKRGLWAEAEPAPSLAVAHSAAGAPAAGAGAASAAAPGEAHGARHGLPGMPPASVSCAVLPRVACSVGYGYTARLAAP